LLAVYRKSIHCICVSGMSPYVVYKQ
jgi:hypothetical protein